MSSTKSEEKSAFEVVIERIDQKIERLQYAKARLLDKVAEIKGEKKNSNVDITDTELETLLDEPTNNFLLPTDGVLAMPTRGCCEAGAAAFPDSCPRHPSLSRK